MASALRKIGRLVRWAVWLVVIFLMFASMANIAADKFPEQKVHTRTADRLLYWITKPDIIHTERLFPKMPQRYAKIDTVVVHCDETNNNALTVPLFEINKYHLEQGFQSISYHLYIDRFANVYQLHSFSEVTAHTAGYNQHTVSVCIQGTFEVDKPMPEQYRQLVYTLYATITELGLNADAIKGHREFNAGKTCPGAMVNMDTLRRDVQDLNLARL